jgi:hypothetical protein
MLKTSNCVLSTNCTISVKTLGLFKSMGTFFEHLPQQNVSGRKQENHRPLKLRNR